MKENSDTVVLVADDEPSTLALVVEHVRAKGFKVIEASDGDMAWQLAHQHLPDLVILDVMMPGMSGWEVCRKIRESLPLAHTGVIMLTGIGQNLNEMTSPLYGADTHVDKPFEFADLDEKIEFTLKERRQGTYGRADKADEVESVRNPEDRPTTPSFVDDAPLTAPTGTRILAKARTNPAGNRPGSASDDPKRAAAKKRGATKKTGPAKKTGAAKTAASSGRATKPSPSRPSKKKATKKKATKKVAAKPNKAAPKSKKVAPKSKKVAKSAPAAKKASKKASRASGARSSGNKKPLAKQKNTAAAKRKAAKRTPAKNSSRRGARSSRV